MHSLAIMLMNKASGVCLIITLYGSKLVILPFGLISSNEIYFLFLLFNHAQKYVKTQYLYMVTWWITFSLGWYFNGEKQTRKSIIVCFSNKDGINTHGLLLYHEIELSIYHIFYINKYSYTHHPDFIYGIY